MNRRSFSASAFMLGFLPATAAMQQDEATPHAQAVELDTRTRDLTELLASISPTALLGALETAEVTSSSLIDAGGGEAPVAVPWADNGDTDLYSSLGGVGLTTGGTDLNDPETEMVAAYIVYESADIAYHEFTRKIGDLYTNPSNTMSVAGTNIWIAESNDFRIGTWRIGNVMMMSMLKDQQGAVAEGTIEHLSDVSTSLTD